MRRKVGTPALWAALSETFVQCTAAGQFDAGVGAAGWRERREMAMYVARFNYLRMLCMLPWLCMGLVIGSRKRCDDGGVGAGGMFP